MKQKTLFPILILLILGFVSCKSTKTGTTEENRMNQSELTEKHWKLVELNGLLVSETSREPFIAFENDENRVHGNTSCNNFFGTFELHEKNKIRFSQIGMTKMACIGNNMETPFIRVLESTTTYKIDNDTLTLLSATDEILAIFNGEIPK